MCGSSSQDALGVLHYEVHDRLFNSVCKNSKDPACVVYADGACTLDESRYKAFVDYVNKNLKGPF